MGHTDRGSMLLQLVVATAVSGIGVATVAAASRPAIDAAHAWTCTAARDTVGLAAVAHLAATGVAPSSISDLTGGEQPELVLPASAEVSADGRALSVDRWSVVLQADGAVAADCTGES